jgi:hypothetical protein
VDGNEAAGGHSTGTSSQEGNPSNAGRGSSRGKGKQRPAAGGNNNSEREGSDDQDDKTGETNVSSPCRNDGHIDPTTQRIVIPFGSQLICHRNIQDVQMRIGACVELKVCHTLRLPLRSLNIVQL